MSQPAVNFPLISNRPFPPEVAHAALSCTPAAISVRWSGRSGWCGAAPGTLLQTLRSSYPLSHWCLCHGLQALSSVLKLGEYRACSAGLHSTQPQNTDNVSAASETQPFEMIALPKSQKHPCSFFDQEVMTYKLLCQIRTHKSWFLGANLWWCQFWTFLNNAVFWLTPPRPRWWNVKMMRNYKSEAQCCKVWLDICSLYYT